MLREVLYAKINQIRRDILDTYMPTEVERLEAQIMALQWVQERLQIYSLTMKAKTLRYAYRG
ncbi:MAG: hypothetical protein ACJ704_04400 [Nitrososphaeraceae archaeon]